MSVIAESIADWFIAAIASVFIGGVLNYLGFDLMVPNLINIASSDG